MKWMLAGCILVALMMTRVSQAQTLDQSRDDISKVFVGYLFRESKEINFKLYTHLCHAFVTADGDGKVNHNKACPSKELAADAHKAGVKVLISLGGWGWDDQFAKIVSHPKSEDRYVTSVMKLVDEFDYDGLDLDWEYPDTATEVEGFERLARRFRKELDTLGEKKGRHLLQTMAASSVASNIKWLKTDFLLETMDWVNVMTYDYAGPWTSFAGHHSPLFASPKHPTASTELTMKCFVDQGMPPNRLAVGLPLYGRGFSVAEPYAEKNKPAGKPAAFEESDYVGIVKLLKAGWTRKWDDEIKAPWAVAPNGKGVVGYDDAESIAGKTEWAMKQGFRGVFFWQIHGDRLPDGTNPLQEASRIKLDAAAKPTGVEAKE